MSTLVPSQQRSTKATHLALVECLGLDLSLFLKTINNILVTPTDLVRETLCPHE